MKSKPSILNIRKLGNLSTVDSLLLLLYGPFDWKDGKWKKRKLQKSINKFRLKFNSNSLIDFHNFLCSHFFYFKTNRPYSSKELTSLIFFPC
jgi:hypothetical protein